MKILALRCLLWVVLLGALGSCSNGAGVQPGRSKSTAPVPTAASVSPAATSVPGLVLSPLPTAVADLDDAEEVASELVAAEQAIRAASTPPAAMERLGRVQQAAYRKLVANAQWRATAIAKAPADLNNVVAANIQAGEDLRSLTKPAEKIPAWKIIRPPPPEELRRYYREAEAAFAIPWAYLASIHLVETRMGRIRGTSSAGAQGPMQFIPATWAAYGKGDINNPKDAIFAAARYLKASGAPGDIDKALYAYNHSQKYVRAVKAYAKQMLENERTYLAFYHWQVYVRTTAGDVLLEVGYGS